MKLTDAQKFLLSEIVAFRPEGMAVSDNYSPAKKLVELGLAEWNRAPFGSTYLKPTEAGRSALKESEG